MNFEEQLRFGRIINKSEFISSIEPMQVYIEMYIDRTDLIKWSNIYLVIQKKNQFEIIKIYNMLTYFNIN